MQSCASPAADARLRNTQALRLLRGSNLLSLCSIRMILIGTTALTTDPRRTKLPADSRPCYQHNPEVYSRPTLALGMTKRLFAPDNFSALQSHRTPRQRRTETTLFINHTISEDNSKETACSRLVALAPRNELRGDKGIPHADAGRSPAEVQQQMALRAERQGLLSLAHEIPASYIKRIRKQQGRKVANLSDDRLRQQIAMNRQQKQLQQQARQHGMMPQIPGRNLGMQQSQNAQQLQRPGQVPPGDPVQQADVKQTKGPRIATNDFTNHSYPPAAYPYSATQPPPPPSQPSLSSAGSNNSPVIISKERKIRRRGYN